MELAPSVFQFLSWKKQKARDAWQHFVLGCLKSVPPWEIPPGADPGSTWTPHGGQGLPKAALGHKSLWDLLENREKGGKPTQTCCDGGFVSTGLELGGFW